MRAAITNFAKYFIYPPTRSVLRWLFGALFRRSRPRLRNQVYLAYAAAAGEKYFCHDTQFGTYIVSLADDGVGRELFRLGQFDLDIFQRALKVMDREGLNTIPVNSRVLLDVGANIGSVSIYALMSGAFPRAIGIEANALNARLLRANLHLNGLEDKLIVIEGAAAGEPDLTLSLELAEGNLGDHRIRCRSDDGIFGEGGRRTVPVRSITVDGILAQYGIDPKNCFMWMDVQGYEGEVLLGARQLLTSGAPFVFELWPYGLRRARTYEKLIASLADYSCFVDLRDPGLVSYPINKLRALYESFPDSTAHADILVWKTK